MTDDPMLSVRELRVEFPTDAGALRAVRGVSFDVAPRQAVAVVGESGSGKSVTALAVMGLLPSWARVEGSVRHADRELLGLGDHELAGIRGRRMAMIFQDPMTSLNPVYTVGWQLAEAVLAHQPVTRKMAKERAVELLELVGIPNARERAGSYPHEFSGGMRQRAAIAMAIANHPDVIIADEPTTALDVTVQAQVLETLERAREETQAALVLITHDLGVVAGLADQVLVMYAGKLVEVGTVTDIFGRPRMPYTVGLLRSLPRLGYEDRPLTPIAGAPPSLVELPDGCPFWPRCPMARPACRQEEPGLRAVGAPGQRAACHFAEEVPSALGPDGALAPVAPVGPERS